MKRLHTIGFVGGRIRYRDFDRDDPDTFVVTVAAADRKEATALARSALRDHEIAVEIEERKQRKDLLGKRAWSNRTRIMAKAGVSVEFDSGERGELVTVKVGEEVFDVPNVAFYLMACEAVERLDWVHDRLFKKDPRRYQRRRVGYQVHPELLRNDP